MSKSCDSPTSSVCTDTPATIHARARAPAMGVLVAFGLGFLIAALLLVNVVGVYLIRAQAVSTGNGPSSCTGQETRYIMKDICTQEKYASLCLDAIGRVEEVVYSTAAANAQDAAVNSIKAHEVALKESNATVRIWGVDERDEQEASHQGFTVTQVVNVFKNPAYRYSSDAHRASVDCGGFSISLWRTMEGQAETQMAYCSRTMGYYRVCAAFRL